MPPLRALLRVPLRVLTIKALSLLTVFSYVFYRDFLDV